MLPYTITDNTITVLVEGTPHVIDTTHPNFHKIKDAIRTRTWDDVVQLIDVPRAVNRYSDGVLRVEDGQVFYGDYELHGLAVDRTLQMMKEGLPFEHMALFLSNLMENPSKASVDDLYRWLERNGLVITENGHIIGYKGVRSDFKDKYTGKINNSPGTIVRMPRNQVCDNRDIGCSNGLHVGTLSYATGWAGSNGKVVLVDVNPKNVVSVPNDCDFHKMRASEYYVLAEWTNGKIKAPVVDTSVVVVDPDYYEYE